jgi:hypothetical protein
MDGFEAYFKGPICGMPVAEFGTFKFRALDFIHYAYSYQVKKTGVNQNHCDYHNLLHWVIHEDTATLLKDYIVYLKICRYRPLTIKHYLASVIKLMDWVCIYKLSRRKGQKRFKRSKLYFCINIFCPCNLISYIGHIKRYDIVKKMMKTSQKTLGRDIRQASSDNTIDALIERRRWPPGGLRQLQKAIEDELVWVQAVINTGAQVVFQAYNKYLQLMVSSAYCFSPQGRVGAIEDLKFGNYVLILINVFMSLITMYVKASIIN